MARFAVIPRALGTSFSLAQGHSPRRSHSHQIPACLFCGLILTALSICSLVGCGSGSSTAGGNGGGTQNPSHLAVWTNSLNGIQFTMVGTDPSIPGAGTTNIPVEIIPVSLNFSAAGIVISPESPACGDTQSVVTRVVNSPLFTSNPWFDVSGTIPIGNTQFGDAFQRMNFWTWASGVSPDYHVMLQPVSVQPTVSIDVPPNIGAILTPSPTCPSQMIGAIPSSLMNSMIQTTLVNQNITPNTLPIFLTYDISFVPENFLGYHNAQGNQTFIAASYIDAGFNDPTVVASDVAVLSHEIGEWMNNPLGQNIVPPWGGFGIQAGCSNQLEVGDPLSRNIFATFSTADFTYHMQELAFVSWFTRDVPSVAINGQYSASGTFGSPAPLCQ